MSGVEIIWSQVGLTALLSGPDGPVARDLLRRGLRVESAAKINASHSPPSVRGSGPAVRTGRLRASIATQLGRDSISLFAAVGSNVIYAKRVEVDYDRPYLLPALEAAR